MIKTTRVLSLRTSSTALECCFERELNVKCERQLTFQGFQQRPNVTRGKKTNNPGLIKNRPRPKWKKERTENVLVLATELTNKIKKVEEMMKALQNKESESYPCVFTDSVKGREKEKSKIRNAKNHSRRSNRRRDTNRINTQFNQRYIKNLSYCKMTTDQINLLSKGLNFIQTPVLAENRIRQQLLLDFKQFARRMRLRYIFHNKESEQHPFHVRSNWEPPVQHSVALGNLLRGS